MEYATDFGAFAAEFVRAYWETVKCGDFPMPPNEPVEQTLEELLTSVSHKVELLPPSTGSGRSYRLHMSDHCADLWDFDFQKVAENWRLVSAAAKSSENTKPHDLLDSVYQSYFGPFLWHVTEVANKRTRTWQSNVLRTKPRTLSSLRQRFFTYCEAMMRLVILHFPKFK